MKKHRSSYISYVERLLNFRDPFCQMLKEHHARMRLEPIVEILALSRARDQVGASCEEDARVKFSYWPFTARQKCRSQFPLFLFLFSNRDSRARFIALHEHAISADSL